LEKQWQGQDDPAEKRDGLHVCHALPGIPSTKGGARHRRLFMAPLSLVSGVSPVRLEPVIRSVNMDTLRIPRAAAARGEDVAEISAGAREAALAEATPIRAELVQRIRQQIAAGTYETDEKLEAVADRVSRELDIHA